jgi:hypothetical protein
MSKKGELGRCDPARIYPDLRSKRKFVWSKRKLGGALLCLPYAIATGVLRILQGYFRALSPAKEKKKGYLGVSWINR